MQHAWYRYWVAPAPSEPGKPEVPVEPAPEAGVSPFHVEPGRDPAARPPPPPRAAAAAEAGSVEAEFHVEPSGAAEDEEPLDTSFARARVLTIANQKGGVGKTTTAVSLAAALADVGARVLLLDLDPQGNASSGVGLRVQEGQATIYDVLVGDLDLVDAIEPTSVRNLFVVPATIDLAGAEIELVSAFSREQKLRRALESVRTDFDVVLIDCPPSLGLLTVNAVSAADGIVVPIQCEYYALEGLGALQRNAELIKANLNPGLEVTGYVMTMMDGRTRLSQQVVDEVVSHFGDRVFTTRIPRSVRLAEAPSYGQPITVFDPSSRGARAYRSLAREVLRRLHDDEPAEVEA
jgi:chromosome partitioning protein